MKKSVNCTPHFFHPFITRSLIKLRILQLKLKYLKLFHALAKEYHILYIYSNPRDLTFPVLIAC